jgi:hypothetical protein
MADRWALGGGEVFQLLRVAANVLNKKLHTADKGWPSSFEIGFEIVKYLT